jgi:predicted outer membrane repeat protein
MGFIFLDCNATMSNITVQNCSGAENGVAIQLSTSNVTLQHCSFLNNHLLLRADTEAVVGGAINTDQYSILTVEDSYFANNSFINYCVTSPVIAGAYGGAIGLMGPSAAIRRCVFVNNSVGFTSPDAYPPPPNYAFAPGASGGAIGIIVPFSAGSTTMSSASAMNFEVSDCVFTGNSANQQGGAVAVLMTELMWFQPVRWLQQLSVVIQNCSFVRNALYTQGTVFVYGGALAFVQSLSLQSANESLFTGNFSVIDCTFVANTIAVGPSDNGFVMGGALAVELDLAVTNISTVLQYTIARCDFFANWIVGSGVALQGGGLFLQQSVNADPGSLLLSLGTTVSDCRFVGNTLQTTAVQVNGAGVAWEMGVYQPNLGAARSYGSAVIERCLFHSNQAASSQGEFDGGGLFLSTSTEAIPAGAVMSVLIQSCVFTNNTLVGPGNSGTGGAISLTHTLNTGSGQLNYTTTIADCTFSGNGIWSSNGYQGSSGGAIGLAVDLTAQAATALLGSAVHQFLNCVFADNAVSAPTTAQTFTPIAGGAVMLMPQYSVLGGQFAAVGGQIADFAVSFDVRRFFVVSLCFRVPPPLLHGSHCA